MCSGTAIAIGAVGAITASAYSQATSGSDDEKEEEIERSDDPRRTQALRPEPERAQVRLGTPRSLRETSVRRREAGTGISTERDMENLAREGRRDVQSSPFIDDDDRQARYRGRR